MRGRSGGSSATSAGMDEGKLGNLTTALGTRRSSDARLFGTVDLHLSLVSKLPKISGPLGSMESSPEQAARLSRPE